MAEIQEPDEAADSRSSVVGQKRDFNESTEYRDVFHNNSSSEEGSFQRSSKRVKQDHVLLDDTGADDGLVVNLSTLSKSPLHAQAEHAILSPVDKQKLTGSLPPAMTWNKGVQSGLRTSFGAKVKPTQQSAPSLPPTLPASDQGNDSDSVAEISSMHPQSSTGDVNLSFDGGAEAERTTPNYNETDTGERISFENERENAMESIGTKTREDSSVEALANGEESEDHTEPIYPRDLRTVSRKGLKPEYGNSKGTFHLLEISVKDQPVSLQDLQFSDFLNSFLDNNLEKLDLLTPRQIRRAFSTYVTNYYGHIALKHPKLISLKKEQAEYKAANRLTVTTLREKRSMVKKRASAQERSQISNEAAHQSTGSTELDSALSGLPLVAGQSQWPDFSSATSTNPRGEVALSFDEIETARQPFPTVDGLGTQRIVLEKIDMANIVGEPERARSRSGFDRIRDRPSQIGSGKDHDEDMVDVDATPTTASNHPSLKFSVRASSLAVVPENAGSLSQINQNAAGDEQNHLSTFIQSGLSQLNATDGEASSVLKTPTGARDMDVDLTDLELVLQQKYFPTASTEPIIRRCLACSDTRHRTLDCPALACNICGTAGSHSTFTCPKSKRCRKCRQRGHQAEKCPEKLLPAKSEVLACDICNSDDHLEESCHFIWRSFAPKPEEIRTVRDIAVHCYTCGGSGHYGPECGLRKNGRILSGGITWSKSNLQKYIDLSSRDRAISSGVDYSIPNRPRKEFSIKGKANDPITFDDSDDEVVSFVRPKINQPAKHGHIHFGSAAGAGHVSLGGIENRRPPNPPRESRPNFGGGGGVGVGHFGQLSSAENRKLPDSARYNRERTFSPPPRYQSSDLPNRFSDDSRHYRPENQPPRQEENSYRPATDGSYPAQDDASGPPNSSRGSRKGKGGRGGGGAGSNSLRGDSKRKPRINKRDRARMTAAKAARQDGH